MLSSSSIWFSAYHDGMKWNHRATIQRYRQGIWIVLAKESSGEAEGKGQVYFVIYHYYYISSLPFIINTLINNSNEIYQQSNFIALTAKFTVEAYFVVMAAAAGLMTSTGNLCDQRSLLLMPWATFSWANIARGMASFRFAESLFIIAASLIRLFIIFYCCLVCFMSISFQIRDFAVYVPFYRVTIISYAVTTKCRGIRNPAPAHKLISSNVNGKGHSSTKPCLLKSAYQTGQRAMLIILMRCLIFIWWPLNDKVFDFKAVSNAYSKYNGLCQW